MVRPWRAFVLALVAGITGAAPAAAQHHPPNSEPGFVTMSITRPNGDIAFRYSVTQQTCPNASCDINFGKPYRIQIFVDAPGRQSGVDGIPTIVSGPPECRSAGGGFGGVVDCNERVRSQTDPEAALPLEGTIVVRASVQPEASAEIVVEGYSLNTFQAGVPVPSGDDLCDSARNELESAKKRFVDAEAKFRAARRALIKSEEAGFLRLLLGTAYALQHDERVENFETARTEMEAARRGVENTRESYRRLCLQTKLVLDAGTGVTDLDAVAGGCSDTQWKPLLEKGAALKLRKFAPLTRKYLAARKRKQSTAATRYRAQVKRLHTAQSGRLASFDKLVRRTCSP